jgi:two-component system, sensor histidine kinase RegB
MTDTQVSSNPFSMGGTQNPIRLRTLVRLRWLAVIGQTIAVLFVSLGLGFKMPLQACLGVIALSAWVNVFLSLRWRSGQMLSVQAAGMLLAYDLAQLALLLYLTGGIENPFAFLFLVPVTVSATSLTVRWTIALTVMAFLFVTLLANWHLPLPWTSAEDFKVPVTYVAGLWTAILCGIGFSAIYARRMAEESRIMSNALNATELVLAREQRLSALDGLAAAAAHELGTPLATIALVAKELKREVPKNFAHGDDIDLLISQAARCREILGRLSDREKAADEIFGQVKLSAMLEDLVAPLRGSDVLIDIKCQEEDAAAEPVLKRNPGLAYGLSNILANAIDFAKASVVVEARWTDNSVRLLVRDDGPGFDQSIIDRLGDPYVTTRPGYDGNPEPNENGQHEGMGLGLFIAKTLLERSGASVLLGNLVPPAHGAEVTLTWPRRALDVGPMTTKRLDPSGAALQ